MKLIAQSLNQLFLNYLQVDIVTMLKKAIDYVKYLQNQVKVHIIYPGTC
jgi:hypothetical protein